MLSSVGLVLRVRRKNKVSGRETVLAYALILFFKPPSGFLGHNFNDDPVLCVQQLDEQLA